jgi:Ran GTPase-activating protein (RanGAP) involved in mRNA processing and transport
VHLTGLQVLDLDDNQVTDEGLKHLASLTGLMEIRLGNTQVTNAGVAELRKSLPNTRIYGGR